MPQMRQVSYHARLRAFSSNASSAAGISFLANYELLEATWVLRVVAPQERRIFYLQKNILRVIPMW